MNTITITLTLVKETKNKWRYEAANAATASVDCIYLRKADVGAQPPKQVRVTVEAQSTDAMLEQMK